PRLLGKTPPRCAAPLLPHRARWYPSDRSILRMVLNSIAGVIGGVRPPLRPDMILRTQTPKRPSSGIQSTAGGGGLRARLRSPAAMGVATVLAATPALAQDAEPATAAEAAQHTADNDPRQSEAGRRAAAAAASSRSTPAAATQRPAPTPSETAANEGEENLEGYALPTVHVSAEGDYKVDEVGMARLSTELVDTPQTVVVVPETLLKEQRAVTLQDALRNV